MQRAWHALCLFGLVMWLADGSLSRSFKDALSGRSDKFVVTIECPRDQRAICDEAMANAVATFKK